MGYCGARPLGGISASCGPAVQEWHVPDPIRGLRPGEHSHGLQSYTHGKSRKTIQVRSYVVS